MKTIFNRLSTKQKKSVYNETEQFKKENLSLNDVLKYYGSFSNFWHACYCYTLFQYVLHGEHAVVLGNKLHSMFSNTNCHKIPEELFNLPFDAFYIQLPDKDSGIFVANQMKPEGETAHIQITHVHIDPNISIYEEGITHIHLPLHPMTPDKDGFIDPEQAILDVANANNLNSSDVSQIARIVCNTILYMNSIDADIKKEHNKTKTNKKFKPKNKKQLKRFNKRQIIKKIKNDNTIVIWIGKDIEDNPNIQSIPTGKSNNWTVRRGHWHSFWTGSRTDPQTKESRKGVKLILKWVKPIHRNIVNTPKKCREIHFI